MDDVFYSLLQEKHERKNESDGKNPTTGKYGKLILYTQCADADECPRLNTVISVDTVSIVICLNISISLTCIEFEWMRGWLRDKCRHVPMR